MENMFLGKSESYYQSHSAIHTVKEIVQQPSTWQKMADAMLARKDEIAGFMDRVLGTDNLRIVFTGAGSSAFVGEGMQYLLANEMGIRSETIHTTDFVSMPDSTYVDVPTLLISYARSGESAESCSTVQFAKKRIKELYQVIIVCDRDSSLAKLGYESSNTLVLDMPKETCDLGFAMTSSVSNMILATWCLFHYKEMETYAGYVKALAGSAERELEAMDEMAVKIAAWDYRRIIWLGTGALKGLAREGAVKSMELTNGYVHAGYDAPTGFRHGPKTVINDETLTVHFLSNQPYSCNYDKDFAREMIGERQKNQIVLVVPKDIAGCVEGADYEVAYEIPADIPANSEIGAYIKGVLFVQLLSLEKSLERNFTTDNPCPSGEVNRVVKGIIIHEI